MFLLAVPAGAPVLWRILLILKPVPGKTGEPGFSVLPAGRSKLPGVHVNLTPLPVKPENRHGPAVQMGVLDVGNTIVVHGPFPMQVSTNSDCSCRAGCSPGSIMPGS